MTPPHRKPESAPGALLEFSRCIDCGTMFRVYRRLWEGSYRPLLRCCECAERLWRRRRREDE